MTAPPGSAAAPEQRGPHHVQVQLERAALWALDRFGPEMPCTLSLRSHHGWSAADNAAAAAACQDVEIRLGTGPSVRAMRRLQVVLVGDVDETARWSRWRGAARAAGFRSCLAVPAWVDDAADLAVTLYSDRVDPWDPDTIVAADTFAQHLAQDVSLGLRLADLDRTVQQMRAAVATRDTVGQAVGALMATRGCTADEAMAVLRRSAADTGADLVDVAARAVQHAADAARDRLGPAAEPEATDVR